MRNKSYVVFLVMLLYLFPFPGTKLFAADACDGDTPLRIVKINGIPVEDYNPRRYAPDMTGDKNSLYPGKEMKFEFNCDANWKPDEDKIFVYINGVALYPKFNPPYYEPKSAMMIVHLDKKDLIRELIRKSSEDRIVGIELSIKQMGEGGPNTKNVPLNIQKYKSERFVYFGIASGVLLLILLYLAMCTGLIRDDRDPNTQKVAGVPPGALRKVFSRFCVLKDKNAPYSLSRTQFLFWTYIILMAEGYYFALTGEMPVLNHTVITVLGIGVGTRIASSMTDSRDTTTKTPNNRNQDFDSEGFLSDILSDKYGLSIHRMQYAAFTVIYGLYFLVYVYNNLDIPVLDEYYDALLGVSALGYAIPKTQENNESAGAVGTPGAAALPPAGENKESEAAKDAE